MSKLRHNILAVATVIFVFSASFLLTVYSLRAGFKPQQVVDGVKNISADPREWQGQLTSAFNYWKLRVPRAYVVQSGSMEPSIKTGSIVISMQNEDYAMGDVVTFKSKPGSKELITHRIMAREFPEGVGSEPVFQTAGDANEDFDAGTIEKSQIVGKVVLTIPYLGYAANYAKTPVGFILLVIVPATIIIYEELKSLLSHIYGGVNGLFRKKKKEEVIENTPADPERAGGMTEKIRKTSILLPAFGAFLVFAGLAGAYFRDAEGSPSNVFQAGVWGASPTISPVPSGILTPTPVPVAQTLVINEVLPDTSCSVGNKEAQWIEVYNGYTTTVNLKNFSITDGTNTIDLVTSNTNISAGQFALIAHDNATWTQCYDDNNVITANFGGGTFNVDTGTLQLLDPSDVIIDTVIWGSNNLTPAQNESIERQPDGLDSATGTGFTESDFVDRQTPMPGI